MRFLVLSLFIFSTGCVFFPDDEKSEFPGERGKKETKPRKGVEQDKETINITTNPTGTTLAEDDEKSDFSGERKETINANPTAESPSENLVFPFNVNTKHTLLLIKSSDNEKFSFSTQPSHPALKLIAGLSGTVSLQTNNGKHYLNLKSKSSNLVLHFELSVEGTTILTSNQAQVNQKDILMTSEQAILYYISSNSEIHALCLDTSDLEKIIQVRKEFPKISDCS